MDPDHNPLSRQPPRLLGYLVINILASLLRSGTAGLRHPARNQAEDFEHFVSILDYLCAAANHHSFERMVGFAALNHDRDVRISPQVYYFLRFGEAGHYDIAVINRVGHRDYMWIAVAVDSGERTVIALFEPFRRLGLGHSNRFSRIRLFHFFTSPFVTRYGSPADGIPIVRLELSMERFLQIV
jgi:hypothetical protein